MANKKNRKNKIKLYISIQAPIFKGLSGATNRIRNYVKHWKGFDINIFTPSFFSKFYKGYLPKNIIIETKSKEKENNLINIIFEYIKRSFIFPNKIKKIFNNKNNNPFIYYSSSEFLPDILLPFYYKLRGKKFVWFIGFHLISPYLFKGYKKMYSKGFTFPNLREFFMNLYHNLIINTILKSKHLNFIMVSNPLDKKRLLKRGYLDNKVVVVPGGIDLTKIPKDNKKTNKKKKKYEACFLGRFHQQKGIEDLPYIWSKVVKKNKDSKLIVIGDGNQKIRKNLIKKIKKYNLDKNIILTGNKQGKEKYNLIRQSKVFICPSYYESFGMVILEAMACGIPVLAYDLPFYDFFFSPAIQTVKVGDKDKFSFKFLELINNSNLRKKLSKEGKKIATNFTWDKTAALIENKIKKETRKL